MAIEAAPCAFGFINPIWPPPPPWLQGASRRPLRVSASKTDPAGPYGQHTKILLDETQMPTKW